MDGKPHLMLLPMGEFTKYNQCSRYWLVASSAQINYLKQCWHSLTDDGFLTNAYMRLSASMGLTLLLQAYE